MILKFNYRDEKLLLQKDIFHSFTRPATFSDLPFWGTVHDVCSNPPYLSVVVQNTLGQDWKWTNDSTIRRCMDPNTGRSLSNSSLSTNYSCILRSFPELELIGKILGSPEYAKVPAVIMSSFPEMTTLWKGQVNIWSQPSRKWRSKFLLSCNEV